MRDPRSEDPGTQTLSRCLVAISTVHARRSVLVPGPLPCMASTGPFRLAAAFWGAHVPGGKDAQRRPRFRDSVYGAAWGRQGAAHRWEVCIASYRSAIGRGACRCNIFLCMRSATTLHKFSILPEHRGSNEAQILTKNSRRVFFAPYLRSPTRPATTSNHSRPLSLVKITAACQDKMAMRPRRPLR